MWRYELAVVFSLSHALASFCLLYTTLLVSCRGFRPKSWNAGYKCGHASPVSEEQVFWLTEIVECRFARAIYSPQFHLTLPLTVAFTPLRETEHTLKYKSGESRHIRSPTPPCRTINHRGAMPITLSPPGSSLHSLPCIQPSLRKVSPSFLKNVQFLWLFWIICECGTFYRMWMMLINVKNLLLKRKKLKTYRY